MCKVVLKVCDAWSNNYKNPAELCCSVRERENCHGTIVQERREDRLNSIMEYSAIVSSANWPQQCANALQVY